MLILWTGALAGALHVGLGPDHLAALAPLSVGRGKHAWRAGWRWGLGHSFGVGAIALIGLALREAFDVEAFSGYSERAVGVLLIAIGLWALRRALRAKVHNHAHDHAGQWHEHWHAHGDGRGHRHRHAAFAIGTLHGFAGSAHFLGVLPALALPDLAATLGYLAGFFAGSVAAMASFTGAVGALSGAARSARARQGFGVATAFGSIAVGLWWLAA